MRNKLMKVLVTVLVAGSMFTACGGSNTGVDSSIGTNTEVNVNDEAEDDNAGMSDKAKAHFDKIRAGIADINVHIDNLLAENPDYRLEHLVEVDSANGLECLASFNHRFDNEEDYEILMETIWIMQYNKYYIEYLGETDTYVEFNFYGAKY